MASIPLFVDRKLFGVLNFYFSQTHTFSLSERHILQVAANTVAIAIGNSQYRQELKDAQSALLNILEDFLVLPFAIFNHRGKDLDTATIGHCEIDIITSNPITCCLFYCPEIVFSSQKERQFQIYQLEIIVKQFKIKGKEIKKIDLRFDKPIIQF